MYVGLLKKQFLSNTGAKISRSARPICFFVVYYYLMRSYTGGWGMYLRSV
jgi:hypothetical protein